MKIFFNDAIQLVQEFCAFESRKTLTSQIESDLTSANSRIKKIWQKYSTDFTDIQGLVKNIQVSLLCEITSHSKNAFDHLRELEEKHHSLEKIFLRMAKITGSNELVNKCHFKVHYYDQPYKIDTLTQRINSCFIDTYLCTAQYETTLDEVQLPERVTSDHIHAILKWLENGTFKVRLAQLGPLSRAAKQLGVVSLFSQIRKEIQFMPMYCSILYSFDIQMKKSILESCLTIQDTQLFKYYFQMFFSWRLSTEDFREILCLVETCENCCQNKVHLWEALEGLKNLSILHLDDTFTQAYPDDYQIILDKILENNPNLCELKLNGFSLGKNNLEMIGSLKKLKVLKLSFPHDISNEELKNLLQSQDLEVIYLETTHHADFNDDSLQIITGDHPKLKKLKISGEFSKKGLFHLQRCEHLEKLHLLNMKEGANETLLEILGKHQKQLRSLHLVNAQGVTNENLSLIAECKQLNSITLCSCTQLTEDSLLTLIKQHPALKRIEMIDPSISPEQLAEVKNSHNNIKISIH